MKFKLLKKEIKDFKGKVFWDESLKKLNSFKVGGVARVLIFPQDETELSLLLKSVGKLDIPYFILGDGSNVLLPDDVYEGAIINVSNFKELKVLGVRSPEGDLTPVYVGAGLSKQMLLFLSVQNGYAGCEFLAGVPGQIGGGLFMNAGTHLGDFSKIVKEVYLMDPDGTKRSVKVTPSDFGYRSQKFCKPGVRSHGDLTPIILGATLNLRKGDPLKLKAIVTKMIQERKSKQPLKIPNCGSTFKNPPGNSAGKLIEAAGLKGFQIGGAMVSMTHANFIENVGNAKSLDILNLISHVKKRVKEVQGIELEEEVIVVR